MSGRGRGRPAARSAQEPAAAGSSRRSARHQQPQNAGEEQLLKQEQPQEQEQQPPPEASMASAAVVYHDQVIDPAIAGPQDAGGMLPPPVPGSKGLHGQASGVPVARRGLRRADREPSMATSINSVPGTDALSSQPEPHSDTAPMLGAFVRGSSVASSRADDTPGRREARANLMTRMLPRLLDASDDLFSQLCAGQENPEVWEMERQGYKAAFDAYRSPFVLDASSPVVNAGFVADSMRLDRSSEDAARVFRIMSAANLTSLLDEITRIDHRDMLPLFQEWDSVFPDSFLGAPSDTIGNEMSGAIIEHILMIRTQLSIFTLEKLKADSPTPFHPLECVARIWCDGEVSGDMVHAFLSNNKDGLQLKPILDADSEAANMASDRSATRFDAICKMLPDQPVEPSDLDLSQINDAFPLDEFLANLRTMFVTECFARIRALIQQGHGAGFSALGPSGASSRADSQIRSQLETDAMAHSFGQTEAGVPHVSYNTSSLRMMKQLEHQGVGGYGDGQPLPHSSYAPAPRIPYPPGFGSDSPSLGYGEPAHQGGFPADGSLYADSAARATSKKRPAEGDASAAGDGTSGTARAPAKKPRVRRKRSEASEPALAAASMAALASTAAAAQVAPSQYPPLPGTQDEPDLEALSQRSKEVTAAARKVKEPQTRQSWLREDVNQLIKAIHTYQCKWSTIEKEIKAGTIRFQRPRDQQALRDKARLLKQDMLKADAPLPRSFDLVVLGKKEREAVEAVGKNPARKEADIDERGHPVNTELPLANAAAQAQLPAPPPPPAEPQPQPQSSVPEPAAA
ncbi:hypothetical protein C8A05DRAFT_16878 [Staphylotrichum tortipilum]|uniref:Myb-like domain-containing protein n=1 Tax=Staphylotrichum tortipilum TaxID=2831512 RepID=A0AAN6MJ73_9PEZI|nr:hypothetical protein C8A05DRAFT_16878 [Staphylotrichum longicolle]